VDDVLTKENSVDEKRRGEIALKLIAAQLMKKSMPAPNDFGRDLGNAAAEIGEPLQDLRDFYQSLLPRMIGKMLGCSEVSVTVTKQPEAKVEG
jgi:hypothetical protein